jgi:hypothetical protein
MRYILCRIPCAVLLCLLLVCSPEALLGGCYTPWATKVVFNGTYQNGIYYPAYNANGQVGLVGFGNKLILTWGDQATNSFHSMISTDGITWTNHSVWSSFPSVKTSFPYTDGLPPKPPPYAAGGVNMTASTSCGYVYAAYADPSGLNIYGARSADGINWYGNHLIWTIPMVPATGLSPAGYTPPPSGYFSTSAPALYGNDSTLPIGFAFPRYIGSTYQQGGGSGGTDTWVYGVYAGKFGCNFENPQLLDTCFFRNVSTGACQDGAVNMEYDEGWAGYAHKANGSYQSGHYVPSGPWSPLWTGATGPQGLVQLRAVAQGNSLGNVNPPIYYSKNQGSVACLGTNCAPPYYAGNWTNNGIGGAVNPADGALWMAVGCRKYNNDTCGAQGWFNFFRVTDTSYNWCTMEPARGGSGEWSRSMPTMTFFNGKLWLAWRGQLNNGNGPINVASINPANLGWTPPYCAPVGNYCDQNVPCCSGMFCYNNVCAYTGCSPSGSSCSSNSECCSGVCVSYIGMCS